MPVPDLMRRNSLNVATALLFAVAIWRVGLSPELPAVLAFIFGGVLLAVIDWRVRRLPTRIVYLTLAGVAGGLYAHQVRFISPESFGFIESVMILSMVVVGGIGSVPGIVVAAVVLTMLPQWFQFIDDYKLLLYGALLFSVMRFSPGGLAGMGEALWRRVARR